MWIFFDETKLNVEMFSLTTQSCFCPCNTKFNISVLVYVICHIASVLCNRNFGLPCYLSERLGLDDTCHKRKLPWRTKTACPAMPTLLSSLASILSSPPRDEHWRAKKRKWYVRKVRLNFPKHWYKRDRETFQVKHNMDGWSSLTQPLKINSKSNDSRHQFCNHPFSGLDQTTQQTDPSNQEIYPCKAK